MGQYTISLMGLIDSQILNNQNTLNKATAQYRIEQGRKFLLPKNVISGKYADEFLDRFIRLFIITNLYENIIYDTCERWILRFQLECELKLPLYYKKYEAVKLIDTSNITEIGRSISKANAKTNSDDKSLSSTFPEHIANKGDFDDVRYMDNGSMSKSNSASESDNIITSYTNLLDRIEQLKSSQTDIISECVADFDNLFMGVA